MNATSPDMLPVPDFGARRRAALARLGGGVILLGAAPLQYASRDTEHAYVADRELYWLTGLTEPGTVAVLTGGEDARLVVFARERDAEAELWAGPRLGPEGAGALSGADEAFALADLDRRLPELLRSADRIHYRFGRGDTLEEQVLAALHHARARGARSGTGPRGVVDPGEILDELRLVKDAAELAAIRRACALTVEGHRRAAAAIGPGAGEWEIEAELEAAFRRGGATRPGFDSIVAGGANACVLHYVDNADRVPDGGLVLIDAGAELAFYHGDVTRTWPASGSFAPAQRDVYQLVQSALLAGVEAVRPGAAVDAVHDAVVRVLTRGLVDLGVLAGDVDGLLEAGAHKSFFPHQTSHWLGLDVHDPGDYVQDGASRALVPGMVLTVEPGLYFRPGLAEGVPEELVGTGVRVEDDVAVTPTGHEVLTAALPTEISAVEALVGARS